MKTKTIIIFLGIIVVLSVVVYVAFRNPKVEGIGAPDLSPEEITAAHKVDMMIADSIASDDVVINRKYVATTTNEAEEVIKVGTGTEFTYRGVDLTLIVSKDGYNSCRNGVWGTSTKAWCLKMRNYQVNANLESAKQQIDGAIAEAAKTDYVDELVAKDL